ncbi:hypothetical protein WJ60_29530 [Burkholderia ubonensis]|nr:hypothetical protein WJ60_29530 [Burkholderia ubonensis]
MEVEIVEPSALAGTNKHLLERGGRYRKDATAAVTGQGGQCGDSTARQRYVSRLTILGVMQLDVPIIQKHVGPAKRQDFASSHCGLDRDNDNRSYPVISAATWFKAPIFVARTGCQFCEQSLFFVVRQPTGARSVFSRTADK